MSYIADAHREWHTVHGKFATCPLDCGADEPDVWECPGCGGECVAYPSSPEVHRTCPDVAACDRVLAERKAQYDAEVAEGRIYSLREDVPF